jgi:flagellar biosynthesis protein FlhG
MVPGRELRQGPVSIRPRSETEFAATVTLTPLRPPADAMAGLATPTSAPTPTSTPTSTPSLPPASVSAARTGDASGVHPAARPRLARAIAVASGKGGVGKTSLSTSLALSIAEHHRRTWLVDGDLGLGNVDVACGITPRWTLGDVMVGRCSIDDALVRVHPSLQALAAGSGGAGLASMPVGGRDRLLRLLAAAESDLDELVVDCGAGVGATVLGFAAAAHEVLVVATPEPASIVDAYGLLKCLVARRPAARVSLVVNQAESREEAFGVHGRIDAVARGHLGRSLPLAGVIPRDEAVRRAARRRRPVVLAEPDAPASVAIRALASRLIHAASPPGTGADAQTESVAAPPESPAQTDPGADGFLGRVAGWLARR